MARRTLLITGFGPFLDVEDNPSAVVARRVADALPDATAVVLPTSYRRCEPALDEAITDHRPAALLLLGLSPHVDVLRVEAVGRNADRSSSPDVDGDVGGGRRIHAAAPPQLAATVDLSTLEAALAGAGVPFSLSTDAGGYVCNHLLFHALRTADLPTVFLHLGPLAPDTEPQIVQGVRTAAEAILASTSE
jgi:pyroglutamyl-peptidase